MSNPRWSNGHDIAGRIRNFGRPANLKTKSKADPETITLRATVIGGKRWPDDYTVNLANLADRAEPVCPKCEVIAERLRGRALFRCLPRGPDTLIRASHFNAITAA